MVSAIKIHATITVFFFFRGVELITIYNYEIGVRSEP